MHRLGFPLDGAAQIQRVFTMKSLTVTGLFTHFPSAAEHPRATKRALSRFAALRAKLPGELLVHAAAGTALGLSGAEFNAVRAGLSLYGYPTAPLPPLRPALRLFAPVVQIRTLPRGARVGYGGAFVTERRSRIGVLPIGYADGLCRAYEGMPVRLFHGEIAFPATLCGRICMDQCMVDLTDTPAEVGDRICLIEDAAKAAAYRGSIPYEVLCTIGKRVWRREKGEDVDRILRNP
jgi:alanine racemase